MSELGIYPAKCKDNFIHRGPPELPNSRLEVIQQIEASKLEIDEEIIAPVTMSPAKNIKA
jgi:hypothetical protein